MAKNNQKKSQGSQKETEVLLEFTIPEELLIPEEKKEKLGIDLEWVSEFETSKGGKFNRFEPADFNRFTKHTYFDNLTSPFSSYSYSLVKSKLYNPKIVLSLDQNGLWFYVSFKQNESQDSKTRITKLTHSYKDALEYLNSLPLEITEDVLRELEVLN